MKAQNLNFLPISSNVGFTLEDLKTVDRILEDNGAEESVDKEYLILNFIYVLNSDKERCVFLIEVLRELGYNIDYGSVAKALHVNLRWYMRVKKKMKDTLKTSVNSHI